jgi:hypothetical protein
MTHSVLLYTPEITSKEYEMKEGFIYIWFDRKRKMYYIGCHWGTIDDGYICSSNRMRDAYRRRPQDFRRRIIKRNIARDELLDEEYRWLQLIKPELIGTKYYNLHTKRFGHWTTDHNTYKTVATKISIANKGRKHPNRKSPRPFSEGHLKKMSERMKGNTLTLGRKLSEEHKKSISEGNLGKSISEETKKKISESLQGHKVSEDTRRKISISQKGKKLSEETRKRMSESKKGKPRVSGSGRKEKVSIS